MSKNKLAPHVDFLDEALEVLRAKTFDAKRYLDDVRWEDMKEVEDREREFKFQKTLVDSYVVWLNEYARMSGVLDKLMELDTSLQKDVRKGSYRSRYMEMLKNNELDDDNE